MDREMTDEGNNCTQQPDRRTFPAQGLAENHQKRSTKKEHVQGKTLLLSKHNC